MNKVYFTIFNSNDDPRNKLVCLDTLTGEKLWSFRSRRSSQSAPTIADGRIYFVLGSSVCCLNTDYGFPPDEPHAVYQPVWEKDIGADMKTSPAIHNGKLYISGGDYFYCLNTLDGSIIWTHEIGLSYTKSSPAIADGKVYVGNSSFLYCFDADNGNLLSIFERGNRGGTRGTPAINNGIVYVGSNKGHVYAFSDPTPVELGDFTAEPGHKEVVITWKTASETDNAGFNIYRSVNGNDYEQINIELIPAEGSASGGAAYEFIDTDVLNRKAYSYMLEDVDLNGMKIKHGPVKATPRLIYGLSN